MSQEWAKNPLPPPEITPKQRILDGDLSTTTIRDFIAYSAPQPLVGLVMEIIKREGGWKVDVCNHEQGCGAGQGLMQIIPSTERVCEEHFEREMDMLTAIDNLDCGIWLLGDGSGITHWDDMSWKTGKKKQWGSGPYYLDDYLPINR